MAPRHTILGDANSLARCETRLCCGAQVFWKKHRASDWTAEPSKS